MTGPKAPECDICAESHAEYPWQLIINFALLEASKNKKHVVKTTDCNKGYFENFLKT